MTFINPTICEAAIVLAAASISLQVVAALARSRSVAVDEPAEPAPVVVTPTPQPSERPSLKLTHRQLRDIAQQLQIGNGRFRSRATKTELLEAIRAHNQQRGVTHG